MKKIILFVILLLTVQVVNLKAQSPKREMRSVWLTTAFALDWPQYRVPATGQAYYINKQKTELIELLDMIKAANLNTVFFQIRGECDAMYNSSYEPWSSVLVTTRGADPGYDPLAFVIEEAHKRGLELHAWLNPYRFESYVGKYEGQAGDYRQTNPEWVLEYPDKSDGSKNVSILDPGNPGVRQLITNVVKEVLLNYDVDGITFDDYFYAYGGTPTNLDAYSQGLYKPAGMDLHDWRRDNVNKMVSEVYQVIQDNKPWVNFGLSTFGIWTTDPSVAAKEGLTLPPGITGLDAYKSIYCDPVAWLKEGTVDYISPQLYWPTTSTGQDYDVLSPWWSHVCAKYFKHLYVSHTLKELEPSSYVALKSESLNDMAMELNGMSVLEYLSSHNGSFLKLAPTEYGKQIQVNREADLMGAPGSVFFRTRNFYIDGFINYLKTYEFVNRSLAPAINWKQAVSRSLPSNIRISNNQLLWDSSEDNVRYVVYAIPNALASASGNLAVSDYILDVSYQKSYDLSENANLITTHTFAVSVLDRFGNEFPAVVMGQTPGINQAASLISPLENQEVFLPFAFEWEAVASAEYYQIEIANDNTFNTILYKRDLGDNQFVADGIALNIGSTYYWRIKTRMNGTVDQISEVRSFRVVKEPACIITSPVNNEANLAVTPNIVWGDFGDGYTYTLQVSKSSAFSSLVYEKTGLQSLSHTIPVNTLVPYSSYYLRVKATMGDLSYAWSESVKFSTIEIQPEVPVILSPEEGVAVGGSLVEIMIKENPDASSFRVELCDRPDFHFLYVKVKTIDAFTYSVTYDGLSLKDYYVRVRANYGNGLYTSWSDVRSFSFVATSVEDAAKDLLKLNCPTRLPMDMAVVQYELPLNTPVKLALYDMSGQQIMLLKEENAEAGNYKVNMATSHLKNGLYILSLQTNTGIKTLKVVK